jgi:hypothetical protein
MLKENYLNIIIAIVIILGLLIVFSIKGWNSPNTPKNKVLIQQVTMESMDSMNLQGKIETNELLGKNKIGKSKFDLELIKIMKEIDKYKSVEITNNLKLNVNVLLDDVFFMRGVIFPLLLIFTVSYVKIIN